MRAPGAAGRARGGRRDGLKVVLLAALVLLLFSILNKDRWPADGDIREDLLREPEQGEIVAPEPFEVEARGFTYEIAPVASYELWGLVVSEHYAGSFIDLAHEWWKDYVNIKDLCVIWGDNVTNGAFRSIDFWSGDFTCNYAWTDPEAGALFSGSQISNNHLLATDPALARVIKGVRRGDQVHLKGWLANYRHKGAAQGRRTSVTRGDTGNGACETVWVEEFEVLRRANPEWRAAFPVSLVAVAASVLGILFL